MGVYFEIEYIYAADRMRNTSLNEIPFQNFAFWGFGYSCDVLYTFTEGRRPHYTQKLLANL